MSTNFDYNKITSTTTPINIGNDIFTTTGGTGPFEELQNRFQLKLTKVAEESLEKLIRDKVNSIIEQDEEMKKLVYGFISDAIDKFLEDPDKIINEIIKQKITEKRD